VAGTKIVHLGDSGVVTDALTLAAISDADVVIVNIDDYVIPWCRIHTFMAEIRARTVIVAHYTGRAWALMAPSVVGAPAVVNYFRQLPDDIVRVVSAESSLGVLPGMPSQFLELTPATLIK
jgi:L-ascorbate metabolism protein UlaG (beta-lactamase superfamily)